MTGKLRITVRDSKSESYSPRNINIGKAKLDIIGGLNEPMKLDGLK